MITEDTLHGHRSLWLENDHLRLAVLPGKGADIPLLFHQPSGTQCLMETPHGLQRPSGKLVQDFLENYEGGWQELFPNGNDACEVRGAAIPFHGEVALLPWEYEIQNESTLYLWVTCHQTPFRIERWMHLNDNLLMVEGRATNLAGEDWPFVWGQHIVLGGDFLEEGCWLEMPAHQIATPPTIYEPATARLAENQWEKWPFGRGRNPGEQFDLRYIPGPQAHSHDDAYVTGFRQSYWKVTNPRLGLQFSMEWDRHVFPWVVLWMPYGGAEQPPLTGIYGVGIEPWVSRYPLAEAIRARQAKSLAPGQSLLTHWSVRVSEM